MKVTRHDWIMSFEYLGSIGLLVEAVVIPQQWLSGGVRVEAMVGIVVSVALIIVAALVEFSVRPVRAALGRVLLIGGTMYFVAIPFVAAKVGWAAWSQLLSLALASAVAAWIGWFSLRRSMHTGAQQAPPADAASPRG